MPKKKGWIKARQGKNYLALIGTVPASTSQNDVKFGWSEGKQCMPTALSALLYSSVKNIDRWSSQDLDFILDTGNNMYQSIRNSSPNTQDYLLATDLSNECEAFGQTYSVTISHTFTGLINIDTPEVNSQFIQKFDKSLLY